MMVRDLVPVADLDPADEAVIDEALGIVLAEERRLARRLFAGSGPPISRDQLRQGPLGRDLERLVLVARGRAREPRERVLAAIEAVLQILFWPAEAEHCVVPRHFWETDLGRLLARAKWLAFDPDDLLPIAEAARRLGVARPTVYRWMDDGTLGSVRDDASGRTFVVRFDIERLEPAAAMG